MGRDAFREADSGGLGSGDVARPGTVLVVDGAIEPELARRGVILRPSAGASPLPVREPDAVRRLHLDVAVAGTDVITAATGRTHRRALARIGESRRAREWTSAAVRLAQEAADAADEAGRSVAPFPDGTPRPLRIAGLLSPLDERRGSDPDGEAAADAYRAHAETLAEASVELLRVAGMSSVHESDLALAAAAGTGLPVWLEILVAGGGDALAGGEPLAAISEPVERYRPGAILVAGPDEHAVARALRVLATWWSGTRGALVPVVPHLPEPPVVTVPFAGAAGNAAGEAADADGDGGSGAGAASGGGRAGAPASAAAPGAHRGEAPSRRNGGTAGTRQPDEEAGAAAVRLASAGVAILGPGDDGSPTRVRELRAVADRVEEGRRAAIAAEAAGWSVWLAEGARRAGRGRGLSVGRLVGAVALPAGIAWDVVGAAELHRIPSDRYVLVAADAAAIQLAHPGRLVDALEPGGWLLLAADDAVADMLRHDGRLESVAPSEVAPPNRRGWVARRRP